MLLSNDPRTPESRWPEPVAEPGAEAGVIGLTLWRAAQAHAAASEVRVHRRHQRSWVVFNVLYALYAFEPVSARDVAEWVGISRQTASNTLRSLEDDGLITRTRDRRDARLMVIRLTDRGRASMEEAMAAQLELDSVVFAVLDDEERRQLASLLDRIRRQIASLDKDVAG